MQYDNKNLIFFSSCNNIYVKIFIQYKRIFGMDDEKSTEKAEKALKTLQKQYKRQNKYISETFDRISVTLPKGTKERIKNAGFTVNGFINEVVLSALDDLEK